MLLTAAMNVVIFAMVGLSFDVGILYVVKAKLSASADAAALAGARSLSRGSSVAAQSAAATTTTQQYFSANFPTGYFLTTASSITTTVTQTSANLRTVSTSATATVPIYFLRILPNIGSTVTVNVAAAAQRRDTNLVLVLDRSNSLNISASCTPMVSAATSFVNLFAEQQDYLGLVTFASSSYNGSTPGAAGAFTIDYPITTTFKSSTPSLATTIGNIVCVGGTNTSMGLYNAYKALAAMNLPGALNVIVFFTDGQPTAITEVNQLSVSSPCYAHPATSITAVITVGFNGGVPPPTSLFGLLNPSVSNIPITPAGAENTVISPPSPSWPCSFNSSGGPQSVGNDIPYVSSTDLYGNSTTSSILAGYAPTLIGSNVNPDPVSVMNASIEAAVNMGRHIVNGDVVPGIPTALAGVVIFSIGLGNATIPPHADVLECISNDPRSSCYDSTKAAGLYISSPGSADLDQAFQTVAAQVLRLSQ